MGELLHQFELQIFAVIGTLVITIIRYVFRPNSHLVYSNPHSFNFLLQPNPAASSFVLATASVWVKNAGRLAATEVEITFNFKPQNYNVWPPRPFVSEDSGDGRHTLKFSYIAPKEFIQIELLSSSKDLPLIVSFRSKEGIAKLITMRPMQVLPKHLIRILGMLILVGFTTLLYFALLLIVPFVPFLSRN
jgi:hypothetical protein